MERPNWWYERDEAYHYDCPECHRYEKKLQDLKEGMERLFKIIYKEEELNADALEFALYEMCCDLNMDYNDHGVKQLELIRQRKYLEVI